MDSEEIMQRLEELESQIRDADRTATVAKSRAMLALQTLHELAKSYPDDERMQKVVKDLEDQGVE